MLGGFVLEFAFSFGLSLIEKLLHYPFEFAPDFVTITMMVTFAAIQLLSSLVLFFIILITLAFGLITISLNYARGETIRVAMLFAIFKQLKRTFFYLISLIIIFLPISIILKIISKKLFFVLIPMMYNPQILSFGLALFYSLILVLSTYLWIRLVSLSFMFLVDKKLNPFAAMKASFQATRGNVFRLGIVFSLYCLFIFLLAISIIGLIWVMPFVLSFRGSVYTALSEHVTEVS